MSSQLHKHAHMHNPAQHCMCCRPRPAAGRYGKYLPQQLPQHINSCPMNTATVNSHMLPGARLCTHLAKAQQPSSLHYLPPLLPPPGVPVGASRPRKTLAHTAPQQGACLTQSVHQPRPGPPHHCTAAAAGCVYAQYCAHRLCHMLHPSLRLIPHKAQP